MVIRAKLKTTQSQKEFQYRKWNEMNKLTIFNQLQCWKKAEKNN